MKRQTRKAIFAGSFDPITNGHLDIICRASKLFDEFYIGVLNNPNKKSLFTFDERVDLIKKCSEDLNNIKVVSFDGLLVEYCKKNKIDTLVRGIRNSTDAEYELQMAYMNKELNEEVETIILPTKVEHSFVSSSLVKEVFSFRGDVSNLVPKIVLEELNKKVDGVKVR